jgi:potassium-transporting ATPase KdpC subunit
LLTGLLYPLLITAIAQLTMKQQADGDFIFYNEAIVGAKLIGQKFEGDNYFWPRPSAIDYKPLPSGGSNLGPTSMVLKKTVEERRAKLLKFDPNRKDSVPSELLFASGSGVDPHLTVAGVYFQIERIAKSREIEKNEIITLIEPMIIERRFGFLGEECFNVLQLNLALDQSQNRKQRNANSHHLLK